LKIPVVRRLEELAERRRNCGISCFAVVCRPPRPARRRDRRIGGEGAVWASHTAGPSRRQQSRKSKHRILLATCHRRFTGTGRWLALPLGNKWGARRVSDRDATVITVEVWVVKEAVWRRRRATAATRHRVEVSRPERRWSSRVAMTFIDQTIVSHRRAEDPGRAANSPRAAVQWVINGYLLAPWRRPSALGGRISDIFGHRKMVADRHRRLRPSRPACVAPPRAADWAETWLVFWRVVQGVGAAIMFPGPRSPSSSPRFGPARAGQGPGHFLRGSAAGLTAIGPDPGAAISPSFTWRAIFWVKHPRSAIVAGGAHLPRPRGRTRKPPGRSSDYLGAVLGRGRHGPERCSACSRPAVGGWGNGKDLGLASSAASSSWPSSVVVEFAHRGCR